MKKIIYFICIFILISCSIKSKNNCQNCTEINFIELTKKIENNDTFIIILKDDKCNICQKYNYVLDNYINKYNQIIYFINSALLNLNDENINNLICLIKEKTGINDNAILPSTLFYLDGILVNVEIGILSEKELADNIDLLFSLK